MDLARPICLAGTAAVAVALGCASTVDQGRIPRDAGSDPSPIAPDAAADAPDVPDAAPRACPAAPSLAEPAACDVACGALDGGVSPLPACCRRWAVNWSPGLVGIAPLPSPLDARETVLGMFSRGEHLLWVFDLLPDSAAMVGVTGRIEAAALAGDVSQVLAYPRAGGWSMVAYGDRSGVASFTRVPAEPGRPPLGALVAPADAWGAGYSVAVPMAVGAETFFLRYDPGAARLRFDHAVERSSGSTSEFVSEQAWRPVFHRAVRVGPADWRRVVLHNDDTGETFLARVDVGKRCSAAGACAIAPTGLTLDGPCRVDPRESLLAGWHTDDRDFARYDRRTGELRQTRLDASGAGVERERVVQLGSDFAAVFLYTSEGRRFAVTYGPPATAYRLADW